VVLSDFCETLASFARTIKKVHAKDAKVSQRISKRNIMKKIYLFITALLMLLANNSNASIHSTADPILYSDSLVYLVVEEMPVFSGGEKALFSFIANNIKYPEVALKKGIQGNVYVSFVVDTMGALTKLEVIRGIGGGCDEEAIRVIKMLPNFSPGKQRGRKVNVYYNIPVKFNLKEFKKKNRK
jgi:TonB family protein